MLIGICGGICSGKSSVASYLIEEHDFKRIRLARTASTPAVERSATDDHVPHDTPPAEDDALTFPDIQNLIDFVTKRWQERWVTTDIWDEDVVDALLKRPFFLLVSVDAPVTLRWERFKAR
ncbi:Cytidine deaminase [Macrophomina phaseolina MS6]|uniref:Cytidine deaminase n=2 Tax=Macrophomina phaseolina TaxID=35725 RepID=K2SX60_MACPH|nr:Cytidine deaminase [Macrophomina phaseolina MS6]